MIGVEIRGDTLIIEVDKFDRMGQRIYDSLVSAIIDVIRALKDLVVTGYLSGQALKYVSGKLASSITEDIEESSDSITGKVIQIRGIAPYGPVHEYGGTFTIPEHIRHIRDGREIVIREHSATFPRRSFMEAALAKMSNEIRQRLIKSVEDSL